jgi:excisionase family DNA binding protein
MRVAPDLLLTVRDVARVLGLSTATIYRLCKTGELLHLRVASAVRVHLNDLRAFLAANEHR